jgi:hypothetical protein
MELQHVLQYRGFRQHKADQALDRVLGALQRDHLGDHEV